MDKFLGSPRELGVRNPWTVSAGALPKVWLGWGRLAHNLDLVSTLTSLAPGF